MWEKFKGVLNPGDGKKPLYKRWWFWVIVVLVLAAIGEGTGSANDGSSSKASSSSAMSSKASNKAAAKSIRAASTSQKKAAASSSKAAKEAAESSSKAAASSKVAASKSSSKAASSSKKVAAKPKANADTAKINAKIVASLKENHDFAEGKLDGNGKPTKNGKPDPAYAWSTYVASIKIDDSHQVFAQVYPRVNTLDNAAKKELTINCSNLVLAVMTEMGVAKDDELQSGLYTHVKSGVTVIARSSMTNPANIKVY